MFLEIVDMYLSPIQETQDYQSVGWSQYQGQSQSQPDTQVAATAARYPGFNLCFSGPEDLPGARKSGGVVWEPGAKRSGEQESGAGVRPEPGLWAPFPARLGAPCT